MRIACASEDMASRVLGVLQRYGVTRGVSWEGGSPLDARMWLIVNAVIDPTVEAAIRHDVDSIAGATIQE